jgi:hypothetical protein
MTHITKDGLLHWAVERWHAEVAHRPIVNVHRRSLDDTWRQVIRRLGGDPLSLIGPAHDELRNEMSNSEYSHARLAAVTPAEALTVIHDAFVADPNYAWSWHCNIAMAAVDAGAPHQAANERVADFMSHAFKFDTRQCTEYVARAAELSAQETPCPRCGEFHSNQASIILCQHKFSNALESKPVAWQFQDGHGDWQECSQETYEGLMAVKARERTRALYESPSVSAQDAKEMPKTLMDEPLDKYANRMLIEACTAWSDVKNNDGTLNEAKCDYARAQEGYARGAIKELAALVTEQDASPKDGWRPIETIPAGVVVVLLNINRHRSDDLLNCCKDIGYLTEGGWFSTFCETRGMTKDAFTHWTHLLPDPEPPK